MPPGIIINEMTLRFFRKFSAFERVVKNPEAFAATHINTEHISSMFAHQAFIHFGFVPW